MNASVAAARNSADIEDVRYRVVEFNLSKVSTPLLVALYILIVTVARAILAKLKPVSSIFPECSVMILLGVALGVLLAQFNMEQDRYSLSASVFFHYLLPPIVFDGGYSISNRTFFENVGSIAVFAVIGTVWNAISIGMCLWGAGLTGLYSGDYPFLHVMLFASLISATDPVGVLTVFEDIHINKMLFTVVFGEALFNDAIALDFLTGGISIVFVAFGGVVVGVVWAVLSCLLTKLANRAKVLSMVFIFLLAYCAYLTAEMLGFSAIISTLFCVIVMKPYVKLNVTSGTVASIKRLGKALATTSESVTFMLIGMSVISRRQNFNVYFIALTIFFCLICRMIGVFLQSYMINKYRMSGFSTPDQLIMAYAGMRGPIAFGLAVSFPDFIADFVKETFVTCCLALIVFNVFIQGLTMIPLLNYLKVERDCARKKDMIEHISDQVHDYTVTGIEAICGFRGYHYRAQKFELFSQRFLKPLLTRRTIYQSSKDAKIFRTFRRVTMNHVRDTIKGRNHDQSSPILTMTISRDHSKSNMESLSRDDGVKFQNPAFVFAEIEECENENS